MSELEKKFKSPASLAGIDEGASVLVGFSGGADSSALLYLLAEYARQSGTKIYAAHINHMIRGEEADRDEEFCRRTAESLGIEIFILKCDVPMYALTHSLSVETAAREVRYDFFKRVMEEHDIPLLATAHNANDNMETVLFNMTRGCGLGGICGIPESRRMSCGTVVRPILSATRSDILDYCRQNSIEYVTDSTNTDTDYTRNKIRAEIIPALIGINENAVENVSRMTSTLRDDAMCLEGMTDWFLEELGEDLSIDCEKLSGSPRSVGNRALMALYKDLSGGGSLEFEHIELIRKMCDSPRVRSAVNLPCEVDARVENGRLYMEKRATVPQPPTDFEAVLENGKIFLSDIGAEIIMGNSQKPINIYKKSILLYFQSDKIIGSLTARNRRAGDKIRIRGINRSVKKLMCDKKIPLALRYRLPVICDGEGIVAVPLCGVRDGVCADGTGENTLCININIL